ncbi:unnamed protein product [Coregonus sp. 'balchen']|nr:unnamed protein product [Coregonus sp. 'balchen']
MEAYQDQLLDSPSKNSYIGSYYQPPDRLSPSYVREAPAPLTKTAMNLQNITPQVYRTTPDAGSKAVIAALKTLQEKILRLEQERKQAEKNVKQFSQAAHGYEHSSGSLRFRVRRLAVSLQKQRLQNSSDAHTPLEKLEKLERDCLKLSKTQSVAEKTSLVRQEAPAPPGFPKNKLPFVAGTSTSPSHSVHANMQSILHMMKHHQPQLCERVRSLRRSGSTGARRALHRAPSTSPPGPAGLALGSLSELLLALQDELGQMSFEHQELVCQMDETRRRETREDLERELELLVKRMEEKGSQITKLRKHQQTVDKLTQNPQNPCRRATSEDGRSKGGSGVRPLPPSPVKTTSRGGKRAGVSQEENLQLLRETQRLCTSLKKDDITWET